MSTPLRILSLYEGFFLGGARIAHTEVLCHLQTHSPQVHAVLGLTDRVVREATQQLARDTLPYQRLQEAAIPVAAFHREGEHPLTGTQEAQLEKLIRGHDVVLSLKEQPLVALEALGEVARPLVVSLHRSDPETQGVGVDLLVKRAREGSLAKVICCAESTREAYGALGIPEDLMVVIPNGIALDRFYSDPLLREGTRNLLGIAPEAPVVILPARFDSVKNIPLFVGAAVALLKKLPEAQFLLCGAGMTAENPELQELLEALVPRRALESFHLLGMQRAMNSLYNAADLVALTSTAEAAPLVLLEGMAAGAVPVTTRAGDAPLLVREEALVFEREPAAAAACWEEAYRTREEHRARILGFREDLSDRRVFEEFQAVLEEVAGA